MLRLARNVHPEPESSSGDATSRLVEAIERLVAQNAQQQQGQQPQQYAGINVVVKQFQDLCPPDFDGSPNPLVAENWILELEKIFLLTDVSETQKVVCASFMLKEGASHWWDMIKRAYRIDEYWMMWALFKTLFLKKYFP